MKNAETDDPKNFPAMLKDNLAFMANYNKGVPKLDVCKPDENGSYPSRGSSATRASITAGRKVAMA